MCAKEKVSDISGNFLSFGSGQEVIKKITGWWKTGMIIVTRTKTLEMIENKLDKRNIMK
jgi:hypothetical protein